MSVVKDLWDIHDAVSSAITYGKEESFILLTGSDAERYERYLDYKEECCPKESP